MKTNSRQALVADVGGTHARFAIIDIDELAIAHFVSFRCEMFGSIQAAIRAYMNSIPHRPSMAGIAIAGPTAGETLHLTNRGWSFTREELRKATGADHICVVNDFAALAHSLPYLTAHDLHKIGGGESVEDAAKVVLGPGTGLGVAGLVNAPAGWIAVPSEGGHISFAVEDENELAIVDHIREFKGHVSAERLISGPGLVRLYAALARMKGQRPRARAAVDIVGAALAREDALAEEALGYFVTWLGRFAGDVALLYGARGGVYLAGGIAPRILDFLATDEFRAAFESKGRLTSFLEPIPVHVITAADAGLRGAAVALSATVPAV